jgi:hypothetical protein
MKILKLLICAALLPFTGHASIAPMQVVVSLRQDAVSEYWMSTNATGNVLGYSTNFDSTLDGSNETNFDRNMNDLPPNVTLHLAPGVFYTRGNVTWNAAPGIKMLGSGMDATILRFSSNTVASFAGQNWHNFYTEKTQTGNSNTVIRDLTLDANYQRGGVTTLGGMQLFGSGNLVSHVKFINGASFTASQTNYVEDFAVLITGRPVPASNNVIEDCVVSGYTCNFFNNLSALGLDGVNLNGRLSRNLIIQTGATNYVYGLGCIGKGFLVDWNVTSNCVIAYHSDTAGGTTNMGMVNNQFYDCSAGVFIANSTNVNLTMSSNTIVLGNFTPGYAVAAFQLDGSAAFTNTVVCQNRVGFNKFNPLYVPRLVWGANATGLIIQGNIVENGITNALKHCSGLLINGNVDTTGRASFINATNTTAQ